MALESIAKKGALRRKCFESVEMWYFSRYLIKIQPTFIVGDLYHLDKSDVLWTLELNPTLIMCLIV